MKSPYRKFVIAGGLILLVAVGFFAYKKNSQTPEVAVDQPLSEEGAIDAYQKLPMIFQKNDGQTDDVVKFLTRNGLTTIFFTPKEVVYSITERSVADDERSQRRGGPGQIEEELDTAAMLYVVRQSFVRANESPVISGLDGLESKVNYFIGNDPDKWVSEAPTFARVHYEELYPGIDLEYSGNRSQLKYEFKVAPGSDPKQIEVKLDGMTDLSIASDGALVIEIESGTFGIKPPDTFQVIDGVRIGIPSSYRLTGEDSYAFEIGEYDTEYELIIDPYTKYSPRKF